ncbi:hypothetical protein DL768_002533 [Monosporascus sp. mg162]|nr:hypothetical protein DL768_002533 [Monosporascus sp. mg162]
MPASEETLEGEPPVINPYEVLGVERTATPDKIKSAYRKAALKHHPDKVSEDRKEQAHETFQSIAFAYAVLSDPVRRKRYDDTGSTSESIVDSDGFSWSDFYREQFRDAVSQDAIKKFAKKYKGSDEEKDDLLVSYEQFKGNWDKIYETVMLSDPIHDHERFRSIIADAIEKGDVPPFKAFTHETKKAKDARIRAAKKEAGEAEEYAKELGVHDRIFGDKKKGKKESEQDLAALIRNNQRNRSSLLDDLVAKYGATGGSKKGGKKRAVEEEPSEEAFQAAAARLKKKGKNAETPVFYPQYCFYLSPTLNKWCPLRATDIHDLASHPGFEGQDVFFSLNHPIKWVRVVGVVVAVDEFHGRRVYTVDDSTGQCIECSVEVPTPPKPGARDEEPARNPAATDATQGTVSDVPADIDVGMVVDVKGRVKLFRDIKQIEILKMQRVGSTEREVQFWNKIEGFRRDVLCRPWVLDRRDVRQAKKQYLADVDAEERRKRRKERDDVLRREDANRRLNRAGQHPTAKPMHREPSTKSMGGKAHGDGQSDSLGL